jgi:hypothetical protein
MVLGFDIKPTSRKKVFAKVHICFGYNAIADLINALALRFKEYAIGFKLVAQQINVAGKAGELFEQVGTDSDKIILISHGADG